MSPLAWLGFFATLHRLCIAEAFSCTGRGIAEPTASEYRNQPSQLFIVGFYLIIFFFKYSNIISKYGNNLNIFIGNITVLIITIIILCCINHIYWEMLLKIIGLRSVKILGYPIYTIILIFVIIITIINIKNI